MKYSADYNATKLHKIVKTTQAQLDEQAEENRELEAQLTQLRVRVIERQRINDSRLQQKQVDEAEQEAKMKNILMRRKLVTLVNQQTQEIEMLQTEVDRLRQKTFPSFVHLSRAERGKVMGNPEEESSDEDYFYG